MRALGVLLVAVALALVVALGTYGLAPAQFLRGAVGLERWVSGLERKTVSIPGFEIAYLDSGGSAPRWCWCTDSAATRTTGCAWRARCAERCA